MYHVFSGNTARFNISNDFGLGTRKKLTIKYNKDSSSNRPTYYVNAAKPTVVVQAAPSGSAASDAYGSLYMMNRVSGEKAYDGDLDEVRFRKSYMVSDNWEEAEYNNQNDEATFWGTWTDVSTATTVTNIISIGNIVELNNISSIIGA